MACPYCQGDATQEMERATALGYRVFRSRPCRRTFNERTGTPFNHLQVPTDIALLVVLWRLRYTLSLRDLAELFLTRGFTFTHETVREWEARFAPLLTERLRAKRRGKAGVKWHADETYVKVDGRWCYFYRAIDADGNLVDSVLGRSMLHSYQHGSRRPCATSTDRIRGCWRRPPCATTSCPKHKERIEMAIFPFVIAIQRDKIADNQFTHASSLSERNELSAPSVLIDW